MSEVNYLTPAELVERYKGTITTRTLANWRSTGDGPVYTKIGGRVLYPVQSVIEWESARTLRCKR
jgi:hypothetical protein